MEGKKVGEDEGEEEESISPSKKKITKDFPLTALGYRRRDTISKQDFLDVAHLNQPDAAKKLGVSVSTIKKRFKELFPDFGRWPNQSRLQRFRDMYQPQTINGVDERLRIEYIVNDDNISPKKQIQIDEMNKSRRRT